MKKYIYLALIAATTLAFKKTNNEPTPPFVIEYDRGDGLLAASYIVAFKEGFNDNTNK